MPVTYSFDDRIVAVRMVGNYSVDELEETMLAGLADPKRPARAVLMFDLTESRALRDRPTEDVRGMARFIARHRVAFNSRLAMVAPSDLAFGLMRLGAVTAEAGGVVAEVFREYAPARAWLLGEGPPAVERDPSAPLPDEAMRDATDDGDADDNDGGSSSGGASLSPHAVRSR
ncbi:MAG TPA: hypothetical protein VFJ74_02425 [Gemmatimonadaceae bacterium]|nr:hypothetical protein [Gemmatimonadaceae bacterium]